MAGYTGRRRIYVFYRESESADLMDLGHVAIYMPVDIELVDGYWKATCAEPGMPTLTAEAEEKTTALLRLVAARLDVDLY